jgi:biopolymer transport protein ExbB
MMRLDRAKWLLAQGSAPATEDLSSPGLWGILFSGGWTGMMIMLALLGLSVWALYLVIDQYLALRRREVMPAGLAEAVVQLVNAGRVREAEAACRQYPSILSGVLLAGLVEAEHGWPEVEKGAEDALVEASARMMRRIEYLNVIGNIAPMVGLLGTVTGMIFAFQEVASTSGTASAGDLAEGIYQALVTTVGGLLVAIPSLAAFAIMRNRVDQLIAEVAAGTVTVLAPLKRRVFRRPSAGAASPVANGPNPPPRN